MVNHAHLCVSNHESIYPTFADESYDPAIHTVATCARSVPLLWFAMFRPQDLITRAFETDDGPYVVVAPVTTRTTALAQLKAALPRLDELFTVAAQFETPARILAEAVRSAPGCRVTIEWDEIEVITEGDFVSEAAAAMASLDPLTIGDPHTDRGRLLRLCGADRLFPPDRPFPADRPFPQGHLIGVGPAERVA